MPEGRPPDNMLGEMPKFFRRLPEKFLGSWAPLLQ
jgi:hypothetical protein